MLETSPRSRRIETLAGTLFVVLAVPVAVAYYRLGVRPGFLEPWVMVSWALLGLLVLVFRPDERESVGALLREPRAPSVPGGPTEPEC